MEILSNFFNLQESALKDDDDDDATLPFESRDVKPAEEPKVTSEEQRRRLAIDITSDDLRGRLNIQNVADLVLLSMVGSNTFSRIPFRNLMTLTDFHVM